MDEASISASNFLPLVIDCPIVLNSPFMPNGNFHTYQLGRSILNLRVIR